MLNDILTAIPIGFVMAFSIGPVFFILLETSIIKGFKPALVFDLGVILSEIVFILLAFTFTGKLLHYIKDDPRVYIFGGIFLILYSLYTLYTENRKKKKDIYNDLKYFDNISVNYLSLFIKGFFINFFNVVVLAFWLGIIVVSSSSLDMNIKRVVIFFSTILLTYLLIDIIKIIIAKKLSSSLTPRNIYKLKFINSTIVFIFGIVLLFQGLFPNIKENIKKEVNKIENIKHYNH